MPSRGIAASDRSKMGFLFRPFDITPEHNNLLRRHKLLRHPVFAWLGLRPGFAQHSRAEHEALQHWATGARRIVEIGVAEGASAAALREVMAPDGLLALIDPYHLSRFRTFNGPKRAAHSTVGRSRNGRVVWIEEFSLDAAREWSSPIDFLFLDGDHAEAAVRQDWDAWSPLVVPGGLVAFHDARVFPGGWTKDGDGPVKAVNDLFRQRLAQGWSIVDEVHSLVVVRKL